MLVWKTGVRPFLAAEQVALDALKVSGCESGAAMAYWMITRGIARLSGGGLDVPVLQQHLLRAAVRRDARDRSIPEAALLLGALEHIVGSSTDQLVLNRSHVVSVLRRFEAAMRRWRWDPDELKEPIRWAVRSEREVQDILWIMLRSTFDDVIDEDTLPKFGHSSYRVDFALPSLGLLIEVKYAYKDADFKKIDQEVMVDSIGYLQRTDKYKELVVFIYDESASVEHHDLTIRTLREVDGIADVIIVSRPGRIPPPASPPRRPSRKKTNS